MGSRISANIYEGNATRINRIVQNTVFVPQDIHIRYMSKFYLLNWSHVIKSHSVSNCTVRSHLSICFHLSINPKNGIQKNLNWQSPLDINHVPHKYSSEFIILPWAQNPCFDQKAGCLAGKWIYDLFQKSEEMMPCGFAREIECTRN